ncbi:carboxylesterase/lipase family protein [Actinomyces qiguomingii]|uniref:carboxylesterase/lipase family protein n=1 Tax=Actinomyces qiguomingii TaxID=2057800 RepID=UPI000CA04BD6|nr:carboxylesterase family protein [Actinomyces qiguomingii]
MAEHLVHTTSGTVRGTRMADRVDYLGIPYAQPPVGPLRLKRAVPVTPWDGVLDAGDYGACPVQYNNGAVVGQEDCLTVNVQRPLSGDRLPVFVWIYGGGYNTGSSSDEMYRGEAFVRDGILFFSFNYRTNVLGFYDFTTYPGCDDTDSNCGLSDQILALNWIRENVEAFGGDPDRITIGGESAGGSSVINMLACPGARGTFTRAIVESGLPNCVMTHRTARENIDLFLEGMHWSTADLRRLHTEDPRLFLSGHEYVTARHQYNNPGMFLPGPVQDDLMPLRPLEAIAQGSADGIPLMIGTNMHEGTMFVHPENTGFPNSWSMVAQMLEKNDCADRLPQIAWYYHQQSQRAREACRIAVSAAPAIGDTRKFDTDPFSRFATDYAFEVPAIRTASAQKKHTNDVWMYRYELITAAGYETGMGASHAFELPFVFEKPDHHFSRMMLRGEPADLFVRMTQTIHGDWASFIKTGEPNSDWPRFEGADSPVRIYDRITRTERLDRRELMSVWADMRFYED